LAALFVAAAAPFLRATPVRAFAAAARAGTIFVGRFSG
jgi:hypothetical protein